MKIRVIATVVLMCAFFVVRPICADTTSSSQGSTTEEIAALQKRPLPAPMAIKVAVLPFWDSSSTLLHTRSATAANWLLWQREGFIMTPLLDGFEALAQDKKAEPGMSLRLEDALRLGKVLGVDWVVYGEVRELRPYKKQTFFRDSKLLMAGMRIAVADVKREELVFWQTRSDRVGGKGFFNGFDKSAGQQKRIGLLTVSSRSLAPLFAAFPVHETEGKTPDSGKLQETIEKNWPDQK